MPSSSNLRCHKAFCSWYPGEPQASSPSWKWNPYHASFASSLASLTAGTKTLERSSWVRISVFGLSGWTGIVSSCDRSKGIATLWSWVWYSCVGTEAPGSQTWEDALLCDTAADSILLAPGFPPKPRDSRVFSTTSNPAATTVARVSKRRFLFISCSPSPLVWPFGRGTGNLLRSRSMCLDLPTFSWASSCLCPSAFFFSPQKRNKYLRTICQCKNSNRTQARNNPCCFCFATTCSPCPSAWSNIQCSFCLSMTRSLSKRGGGFRG